MLDKEVPTEISRNLLRKILENKENQSCVDCSLERVTHASISHGVFICSQCASLHQKLRISTKDLQTDSWQLGELRMLVSGGNPAFHEFFAFYSLLDMPVDLKYRTKAAYFYREVLSVLAQGQNYDGDYPTVEEGVEVFEEIDLEESSCESTCHSVENKTSKWGWFKETYLKYPEIGMKGLEVVDKGVRRIKEIARVDRLVENAKKSFLQLGGGRVTGEAQRILADVEKYLSIGGGYIKAIGACANPRDNFED